MNIKTQQPFKGIYSRKKATLKTLSESVGMVAQDLYNDAVQAKLFPAGPVYWIYYNADGNPDTEFDLEVVIPVQGEGKPETYDIKDMPSFKHASTIHYGKWEEFAGVYKSLINDINAAGHQMTTVCRELYINVDFEHPENNITEVQVGIQ